ncbi:MAG: hypothetical protein HC923_06875 [Myxococcales bacterium]|nr:hypothetical protein [Myxococcales bacterium]
MTSWPYWWIAASLLANVAMIANEVLNRQSPTFLDAIKVTFIPILIGQVLLWYLFRHAPSSLLTAWIAFSIGNSVLRLTASSVILREPVDLRWATVACFLMLMAGLCIRRATS